ncbi:serine/threonine protein kinase [Pyxidicoccus trucidator]|uniref:serine/threonine protein kinase n=1 Tax=Pyxidicoccus trucidator TaxID=2709662 RepID=UPI001F07D5B8|nr:serine/threonine-protein kinase [Pyxidicoccus trucidator]
MSAPRDAVGSAALLGRYELVSELGHGGMAKVFRARAAGPGGFEKTLVVKCILPHLAQDPQFVEMFLAEARLAARLNHPNLVQIFDFGEAEGAYFLAMEYIDGPTLRALLRRLGAQGQAMPYPLCARIASAVCEGLTFAHEFCDPDTGEALRMIHRDVSPDNILLSRSGNVKLVDFGIAKVTSQASQTRVGTLKGKVPYMAPEQLRNEALDPRMDVYSLGVVLYEMVAGAKPFEAGNEAALMHSILFEPFIPVAARREDVPEALERIIQRALAKDRATRYASCREMQADLDRYLLSCGHPVGTQHVAQLITRAAVPIGGSPVVGTPVSGSVSPAREGSRGSGQLRPITGGSMRAPTEVNPEPPSTGPTNPQLLTRGRGALLAAMVAGALLAGAVAMVLRPGSGDVPSTPSTPVAAATARGVASPTNGAAPTGAPGATTPEGTIIPPAGVATTAVRGPAAEGTVIPPAGGAAATPEGTVVPPAGGAAVTPEGTVVPRAGGAAATPEGTVIPPTGGAATALAQAPAEPTEVELQVTVTPRKAQLRLDDKPLVGNPFSDSFPRDGRVHTLRVTAAGYAPVVKEVRFDRDLALDITLSRRGQESRRPAVVESTPREPAQAQPQEPDFAELPAKPTRRKPPRRTLDPDNPWAEQGNTSSSEGQ